MRKHVLYSLETPYREPLEVVGYDFGDADANPTLAIVGALRGNEVQQMFSAANMVRILGELERTGQLDPGKGVRVVPSVNHFSMNVGKRFWAMDNTDINRMLPGYDQGETTQRIAEGLFSAVKDFEYGIQLCSFYLPGDFTPHVRITDARCEATSAAFELATAFELPFIMRKEPTPFDTTTLNYNWQVWDTKAFSLYSKETDDLDFASLQTVTESVLRFMRAIGICHAPVARGVVSERIDRADLLSVPAHHGGILIRSVGAGDHVSKGQAMGSIRSPLDASLEEELVAPTDGYVFFNHKAPLITEHTAAFKLVPYSVCCALGTSCVESPFARPCQAATPLV